jgi:hypothetical protein
MGMWDGTNESVTIGANGEYFVKVDSIDPYGVVRTVTLAVTVARKVAKLTILVYNSAGEVVRHLTGLEAASVPQANQVVLSSEVIQPGSAPGDAHPTLTVSLAGSLSTVWDGRTDNGTMVADGTYFVEVRSEGEAGTNTVVVKSVSVLSAPKQDRVRMEPNVLTRAKPVGVARSKPGETLHAVIYTAAGEKAGVVWGRPGEGSVAWDSTGKASGVYLLVITVDDDEGRVLGRSVLKIIVR